MTTNAGQIVRFGAEAVAEPGAERRAGPVCCEPVLGIYVMAGS